MHAVTQFILGFMLYFLAFSSLSSQWIYDFFYFTFWLVRLKNYEAPKSLYLYKPIFGFAFSFGKQQSFKYPLQTAKA